MKSQIEAIDGDLIPPPETKTNIIDRLLSIFNAMVKDSDFIPAMLRPTVNNLVLGYLKRATPSEVRKIIIQIRDQVIPYLLEDDKNNEL